MNHGTGTGQNTYTIKEATKEKSTDSAFYLGIQVILTFYIVMLNVPMSGLRQSSSRRLAPRCHRERIISSLLAIAFRGRILTKSTPSR